jgi:hypothetical protein
VLAGKRRSGQSSSCVIESIGVFIFFPFFVFFGDPEYIAREQGSLGFGSKQRSLMTKSRFQLLHEVIEGKRGGG